MGLREVVSQICRIVPGPLISHSWTVCAGWIVHRFLSRFAQRVEAAAGFQAVNREPSDGQHADHRGHRRGFLTDANRSLNHFRSSHFFIRHVRIGWRTADSR